MSGLILTNEDLGGTELMVIYHQLFSHFGRANPLPVLDQHVDDLLPQSVVAFLFGGGPDVAREVLSAVSGSLITVTSLTLSLTVATLQLASSQFSPRLLRTFSRDRFVLLTLTIFLGTFTYSLIVLRTVRKGGGTSGDVVPRISVTVAVLLTLASVMALVLFLAHITNQIRVETVLDKVHSETTDTLHRVLEPRHGGSSAVDVVPAPLTHASIVVVSKSGFLVSVEEADLLEAAIVGDAVILIEGVSGQFTDEPHSPGQVLGAREPAAGRGWARPTPRGGCRRNQCRPRTHCCAGHRLWSAPAD